jgi:DNA-binding response OmpR family regulator
LFYLLSNLEKYLKERKFFDKVWGNEVIVYGRTIDVHIENYVKK